MLTPVIDYPFIIIFIGKACEVVFIPKAWVDVIAKYKGYEDNIWVFKEIACYCFFEFYVAPCRFVVEDYGGYKVLIFAFV
jgi:hypothetical protein